MEPEVETKVLQERALEAARSNAAGVSSQRAVGRYELLHRLGYGGMATVYLARASSIGGFEKLVAVKVIHQHLAAEPEFVGMFLDEARIAASLRSPHIGEVLDVGEDSGLYFMVMEYIEGETLSALLRAVRDKATRLQPAVILQIMADACEGLSAVHSLTDPDGNAYDLVHRDVSPQNLLITMDGWVKLVDFGIVKATGVNRSTLTGHLRGKLPYMAPEQACGKALSRASDVFALGVILWELCAGRRLFAGANDADTLSAVMRCEIPTLRDVLPAGDVPEGVQAILDRALAVDPEARYATAVEMLEELRARLWSARDGVREDPRHALSRVMRELFGEQAAYRRATARGKRAGPATRPVSLVALTPTPTPRTSPGEQVGSHGQGSRESPRVVRSLSLVTGGAELTPARSDLSAPGLAALGAQDEPQTLTTSSIEPASPRHWSFWLLLMLPFVGAGIAVMAINVSGRVSVPIEAKTHERTAAQTPVAASTQERVTWLISSEPAGAVVSIEGLPEEIDDAVREQLDGKTTPVVLELPFHREPVTVSVALDGFRSRRAVRMPVSDENLALRLESLRDDAGDAAPGEEAQERVGARRLVRPTKLRFKQPTRSGDSEKPAKKASAEQKSGERAQPKDGSEASEIPLEPSFKPLRPRDEPGG